MHCSSCSIFCQQYESHMMRLILLRFLTNSVRLLEMGTKSRRLCLDSASCFFPSVPAVCSSGKHPFVVLVPRPNLLFVSFQTCRRSQGSIAFSWIFSRVVVAGSKQMAKYWDCSLEIYVGFKLKSCWTLKYNVSVFFPQG